MTIEDLRQLLIRDLEPAYFIGGFGGAMIEIEEIKRATDEEVIEIAKKKGYHVEIIKSDKKK
ncbi:MAG: hypothetical protein IKF71_03585 [Bacilli bacterium]|nr:hypothetical protein [Bacilli bacterium]